MRNKQFKHLAYLVPMALMLSCVAHGDSNPKEFSASIGGFLGASYEVVWDGSVIRYSYNPQTFTSAPGTKTEKIHVSEDAWTQFRKLIDSSNVWTWKTNYDNPDVADGTVWHVRLSYPDQSVESRGSNAFPPKDQFEIFLTAIRALIDRDFK